MLRNSREHGGGGKYKENENGKKFDKENERKIRRNED